METETNLAKAIKYVVFHGLANSDQEIAEMVETSKGNLSTFKNGKKPTPKRIAAEFQRLFGIDKDFILGKTEEMLLEPKEAIVTQQDRINSFLLNEIASIKAQIKGTLATDELKELKQTFDMI